MNQFLESNEYKALKIKYEAEYFKLFGKYCYYNNEKITEKSPAEMAEYFKNKKVNIEVTETETTKAGKTVTSTKTMSKSFYNIWSEDPNMKEYREAVFNCNVAKVKPDQYNMFTGFNHLNDHKIASKISLNRIFEHIRSLVNFNEDHFTYFISFLAQLVQYPHILPHVIIIFISDEGVGKDKLMTFLSECIGDHYCFNTDKLESICGKFNSMLGGKLLITINETDPSESRERIENIKFISTASKVTIEKKGVDAIKADNYARMIFFSNRLFAFPVEKASRRPVIFQSSKIHLPAQCGVEANEKYFTELVADQENKDCQKLFLEYLKSYDIKKWNPKDFVKSELHATLEENSYSPLVSFLATIVNLHIDKESFKMSTTEALTSFTKYMKEMNCKFEYTQQKFNVELENTYKVRKIKNSGMYFVFDIAALKKLLEKEYKYNFNVGEEKEEEDEEINKGVDKTDQSVNTQQELLNKIAELTKQLAKYETKQETKISNNSTFNMYFGTSKVDEPNEDEQDEKLEKIQKPKKKSCEEILAEVNKLNNNIKDISENHKRNVEMLMPKPKISKDEELKLRKRKVSNNDTTIFTQEDVDKMKAELKDITLPLGDIFKTFF